VHECSKLYFICFMLIFWLHISLLIVTHSATHIVHTLQLLHKINWLALNFFTHSLVEPKEIILWLSVCRKFTVEFVYYFDFLSGLTHVTADYSIRCWCALQRRTVGFLSKWRGVLAFARWRWRQLRCRQHIIIRRTGRVEWLVSN
jgi:hypothetical protein